MASWTKKFTAFLKDWLKINITDAESTPKPNAMDKYNQRLLETQANCLHEKTKYYQPDEKHLTGWVECMICGKEL